MVNFTVTGQGLLTLRPGVGPGAPLWLRHPGPSDPGALGRLFGAGEFLAVATSLPGNTEQTEITFRFFAGRKRDSLRRPCCPGPLGPKPPGSSFSPSAESSTPCRTRGICGFLTGHFHRGHPRLPGSGGGGLCPPGGDGGQPRRRRHGPGAGEPADEPAADLLQRRRLRRLPAAGGGGGGGRRPGERGEPGLPPAASTPRAGSIPSGLPRRRGRTTWRSPTWPPPPTGPGSWGCGVPETYNGDTGHPALPLRRRQQHLHLLGVTQEGAPGGLLPRHERDPGGRSRRPHHRASAPRGSLLAFKPDGTWSIAYSPSPCRTEPSPPGFTCGRSTKAWGTTPWVRWPWWRTAPGP